MGNKTYYYYKYYRPKLLFVWSSHKSTELLVKHQHGVHFGTGPKLGLLAIEGTFFDLPGSARCQISASFGGAVAGSSEPWRLGWQTMAMDKVSIKPIGLTQCGFSILGWTIPLQGPYMSMVGPGRKSSNESNYPCIKLVTPAKSNHLQGQVSSTIDQKHC